MADATSSTVLLRAWDEEHKRLKTGEVEPKDDESSSTETRDFLAAILQELVTIRTLLSLALGQSVDSELSK